MGHIDACVEVTAFKGAYDNLRSFVGELLVRAQERDDSIFDLERQLAGMRERAEQAETNLSKATANTIEYMEAGTKAGFVFSVSRDGALVENNPALACELATVRAELAEQSLATERETTRRLREALMYLHTFPSALKAHELAESLLTDYRPYEPAAPLHIELKSDCDTPAPEAIDKLRCSKCRRGLATVSLYIQPKEFITVLCGDCKLVMEVVA